MRISKFGAASLLSETLILTVLTAREKASRYTYGSALRRRNVSLEQYEAMAAAQQHCCAVCNQPERANRRLSLDHDHETGRNRQLLCAKCNKAIGLFDDSPELLIEAAAYLHKHGKVS